MTGVPGMDDYMSLTGAYARQKNWLQRLLAQTGRFSRGRDNRAIHPMVLGTLKTAETIIIPRNIHTSILGAVTPVGGRTGVSENKLRPLSRLL